MRLSSPSAKPFQNGENPGAVRSPGFFRLSGAARFGQCPFGIEDGERPPRNEGLRVKNGGRRGHSDAGPGTTGRRFALPARRRSRAGGALCTAPRRKRAAREGANAFRGRQRPSRRRRAIIIASPRCYNEIVGRERAPPLHAIDGFEWKRCMEDKKSYREILWPVLLVLLLGVCFWSTARILWRFSMDECYYEIEQATDEAAAVLRYNLELAASLLTQGGSRTPRRSGPSWIRSPAASGSTRSASSSRTGVWSAGEARSRTAPPCPRLSRLPAARPGSPAVFRGWRGAGRGSSARRCPFRATGRWRPSFTA